LAPIAEPARAVLFDYQALDTVGAEQRGRLQARDKADAVAQLVGRGLTPLALHAGAESDAAARAPGQPRPGTGVSGRMALVLLIRELATLLGAGVTLEESLRTLLESRSGLPAEAPLRAIVARVLAGERFSTAVRAQMDAGTLTLPSYVVALISAGESTGDLAAALGRAAEQLEFDEQLRAETSEALVYPLVLVGAGTAAVLFVFSFVVPRFSALLAGRQADLPWLSSAVLGIGTFVNEHSMVLLLALAGAAIAGAAAWRALGTARIRSAGATLPILGNWLRQQELSRWTGMLALMLQSRVPILTALDLTASAVGLPDMAARLRRTAGDIGRGESLAHALAAYGLLPPSALSMVRVGERTGQLGPMMGHVAAYTLEQNRRQRRRLVALIEPAAILILGAIIAFVIVGVVLALTSLSDVKL
jgi:general secretion pathway protein F